MADAVWPFALPPDVQIEGYTYQPGNDLAATEMDVGPPKVRRRSSAAPGPEQWTFTLTYAEKLIFEAFFRDDLAQGALTFEYGEPGAPLADWTDLTTEDDFLLITEDDFVLTLTSRWTVVHDYRFVPTGQPWQFSALGHDLFKLTCSVLRLN